jgi:CysZ protein
LSLLVDLGRALGQLGDPRFLRLLLRSLAITVAALAILSWVVVAGLGWILPETVNLPWIGQVGFLDDVASWAAIGAMLLLSVVLMVPVAAAVVGFFLDEVAAAVETRSYPALPPARAQTLAAQVGDSLRFFALVVGVNLVALVIYLGVAPLAPFVFWAVNGFLLGREYFQLVALRRLAPDAATALRRRHSWRIWLAGTAMAVPLSVPLLNLVVPIVGVAVFTHQFHRLARDADAR